jgi:putative nucleotidyltransferase with HDIG domain
MQRMRFEFVLRSPQETARSIALSSGETLTFGRLKTCDVQLSDESVSRRHCTVQALEAKCVVADLQSANGTFVNEQRVTNADLNPGDTLRLGAVVIELVSAATTAPPTVTPVEASLNLTSDEAGKTLVRKAVDPNKLEFLSHALQEKKPTKTDKALLESAQRYLSTLHKVSDVLSRATSIEELIGAILSAVLEATKGHRAAILMRPSYGLASSGESVEVVGVRVRKGARTSGEMVLSRTIVRDVLDQGISAFTHDALADDRYSAGKSVVRQRLRSVMCAPMRTADAILGVLYVDSYSAYEFDELQLELLAAIGNQAGVALHRMRLVDEMERLFRDVTRAIAAIIDAKDGYTHRHSERVAAFAVRLARELGLTADERSAAELAGLLHDLGKIGVPDAILNKPGELTEFEYIEMRRHPVHGAEILSKIQNSKITSLLPGVKYHHERWDGTGYPEGLQGDAIPLLGRILAVADVLDALTSDRAYHTARSLDEVLRLVQAQSGRAFDPKVVAAAVALHAKGELALPIGLLR